MSAFSEMAEIELARNRFSKVTERFMNYSNELRHDLTNIKPNEMFLTRIEEIFNQHETLSKQAEENTFEGTLYSSQSSNELAKSTMRRSTAKINLLSRHATGMSLSLSTNASNEGESIISTAEEHATSQILVPSHELNGIKPKSTSSTVSLAALLHEHQLKGIAEDEPDYQVFHLPPPPSPFKPAGDKVEMTFQVDVASTPKKGAQRSSTPKHHSKRKAMRVRSSCKKPCLEPFSSTLLSLALIPAKNEHIKQIPPPLLSSSMQSSVEKSLVIARSSKKRDRSCSCSCSCMAPKQQCKEQKIKRIKMTGSSTKKSASTKRSRSSRQSAVKCKIANCQKCDVVFKRSSSTTHHMKREKSASNHHHHQQHFRRNLFHQLHMDQPQFVSTVIEQPAAHKHHVKSQSSINFMPITSSTMKKMKYPVKFYPKAKAVDIDRLKMDMILPYECAIKPSATNYYQVGDYNVWII